MAHMFHQPKKGSTLKSLLLFCVMTLCAGLSACRAEQSAQPKPSGVPVSFTGIDHLADHLSIQDFWVDGVSGFQAGTGARIVCCASLPQQWSPGLTVVVKWGITNWRDCDWELHERRVPVDRYEGVHMWPLHIHFLADGSVRAVSSKAAPDNPNYLGPHDPVPNKRPYLEYDGIALRCPVGDPPAFVETLDSI